MSETKQITFEAGYRRLQEIAEEVNKSEVPVDKMADLFAEGMGLEKALSNYLSEQKTRIEAIGSGDGVQAFEIVATSEGAASTSVTTSDFQPVTRPASPSEEDIPF
jgi:exodeoxyribonuclease VII small subunit